jgi:glycerophosphoryl diester phosphodiesterase
VKLSKDGIAFLLHDATLPRTTNGHGRSCDYTWAELAILDAGDGIRRAFATSGCQRSRTRRGSCSRAAR